MVRTGRGRLSFLFVGGLQVVTLISVFASVTGCAKSCSQKKQRPGQSSAQPKPAADEAETAPVQEAGEDSIAAAIRRQDYQTAAKLIDQSPPDEKRRPEVRLARARVALALDDVNTALEQVTGLDEAYPDLEPLAREVVLESARRARDITVLEHLLGTNGKSGHTEDRLALLLAYETGGQQQKALSGLSQMIASLRQEKRPSRAERDLLARVTRKRAQLLETLGSPARAATDYRWLALETPTHADAVSADQFYEHLSKKKLTQTERLKRAEELSETGNVLLVEEELRRLAQAPGVAPEAGDIKATLAWAVYVSRTDYERASRLFAEAAALDPHRRSERLYYSAKSLARAHQHQKAIHGYEQVAKLPSKFADHASYNSARLQYIDGNFNQAIKGYVSYLGRFPGGSHREEARYELAVSRLASKAYGDARRDLQGLVRGASSDRERARLLELEGVAAEGQGDHKTAQALYEKAIALRPLSFSALLAAARLDQSKHPVPPALPPLEPALKPKDQPLHPPLPDVVRRLDRVGLDEDAEQALREREREIRQKHGTRGLEALCQLYGELALAERRYQIAQTAASWTTLSHEPTPNNLWQWECIYPMPHAEAVRRETRARKVPLALVYAVMRQESAFRPRVESPAKAVGLMQIIGPTAKQIAAEIGDEYHASKMVIPAVNVRYGTYYLRRLLDMFGARPALAAAAYNAGPHAVESWLRGGDDLPLDLFVAKIPYRETRNYVYRVMGNYARYQYLADGTVPTMDLSLPQGLKASAGAY